VEVRVNGEALGRGQGGSRQEAEKQAALEALPVLRPRLGRATTTDDAGAPGAGIGA
jgi:hypothetical protein